MSMSDSAGLPVGGERHEQAVAAARDVRESDRTTGYTGDARAAIAAYFAELDRQGVRLLEQPKCPDCDGTGCKDHDPDAPEPCSRCGGSGYEPLVPLGEVEWYMDHQSWRCAHPPHYYFAGWSPTHRGCPCGLDELMRRFGGGER